MKRKNAFTMVELVIVIAVIAVLAAVLIPTFATVIEKARNAADTENGRNAETMIRTSAAMVDLLPYYREGGTISLTEDGSTVLTFRDGVIRAVSGKKAVDVSPSFAGREVYLEDLTNDGVPELCVGFSMGSGIISRGISVFDCVTGESYGLHDRMHFDYYPYLEDGILCVAVKPYLGTDVSFGVLSLADGVLSVAEGPVTGKPYFENIIAMYDSMNGEGGNCSLIIRDGVITSGMEALIAYLHDAHEYLAGRHEYGDVFPSVRIVDYRTEDGAPRLTVRLLSVYNKRFTVADDGGKHRVYTHLDAYPYDRDAGTVSITLSDDGGGTATLALPENVLTFTPDEE